MPATEDLRTPGLVIVDDVEVAVVLGEVSQALSPEFRDDVVAVAGPAGEDLVHECLLISVGPTVGVVHDADGTGFQILHHIVPTRRARTQRSDTHLVHSRIRFVARKLPTR